MSGDAVFPIPEPTFLWVHALTYIRHDGDDVVTDSEGRWHYDTTTPVAFTGYITAPNPREVARAASQDVIIDAVALAPLDCGITDQCSLIAPDTVPRGLPGIYTVTVIRPNLSHLRCLLTRLDADAYPVNYPSTPATITVSTVGGSAGV
jgi:hypothetical protein